MGYAPARWNHARALARLRDVGVVKGVDNSLWLDEAAWAERRGSQRTRALALLALGVVSGAIAAATSFKS